VVMVAVVAVVVHVTVHVWFCEHARNKQWMHVASTNKDRNGWIAVHAQPRPPPATPRNVAFPLSILFCWRYGDECPRRSLPLTLRHMPILFSSPYAYTVLLAATTGMCAFLTCAAHPTDAPCLTPATMVCAPKCSGWHMSAQRMGRPHTAAAPPHRAHCTVHTNGHPLRARTMPARRVLPQKTLAPPAA